MKFYGITKNLIDKTKNGENITSLGLVEVVLAQYNLVDSKNQRKCEVLLTFTPNKSYAYLVNVEPNSLVFFKTYNTEFVGITTTFTYQTGKPLEVEGKVNLTFLINKWE